MALLGMPGLLHDFVIGTQSHIHPERNLGARKVRVGRNFEKKEIEAYHSYRCQISNLHPEGIIWELLHSFGSNNQPLVEEASNEVNSQKKEHTERRGSLQSLIIQITTSFIVEAFRMSLHT